MLQISEREYNWLVGVLDKLIDRIGENEAHPLAFLMGIMGTFIEGYENEHIPELDE